MSDDDRVDVNTARDNLLQKLRDEAHLIVVDKSDYEALKQERETLKAQNEKMREALSFYANRDNWYNSTPTSSDQKQTITGDVDWCSFYEVDIYSGGKLARQVLKELDHE
jgi:Ni,Fe-hydrogenase maturation factor